MSKIVQQATDQLRTLIIEAVGRAVAAGKLPAEPIPDFTIEVPADRSHGDWAANAAMVSARAFRMAPRKLPKRSARTSLWTAPILKNSRSPGPAS